MAWIDDLIARQKKGQTLLGQYQAKRAVRFAPPRQLRYNPFRDKRLPPPPPPEEPPLPPVSLSQLLGRGTTTAALATRPAPALGFRREAPTLAELLRQRQAISPVSARVTAPFRMPEAPVGELRKLPQQELAERLRQKVPTLPTRPLDISRFLGEAEARRGFESTGELQRFQPSFPLPPPGKLAPEEYVPEIQRQLGTVVGNLPWTLFGRLAYVQGKAMEQAARPPVYDPRYMTFAQAEELRRWRREPGGERTQRILKEYAPQITDVYSPLAQEYEQLPWGLKIGYELPVWALMSATSATSLRGSLAPIIKTGGKRGVAAELLSGALAPVAGVEQATGIIVKGTLKYGIEVPVKTVARPALKIERQTVRAFENSLDNMIDQWIGQSYGRTKWVTTQARITEQDWQYRLLRAVMRDKAKIEQSATENFLKYQAEARAGRMSAQAANREAVKATVQDIEIRLLPKGTQTGAMAFGGREVRLSPDLWNTMPVAQRVAQAQSAGLSGQVGSKAFEALTAAERTALGKVVSVSPFKAPPGRHEVPVMGEPGAIPEPVPPDVAKAGRRRVIENRLRQGLPVSDKLLAEFPDLQTKIVGGFVAPTPKGDVGQALETGIKQAKRTGQNVYVFPTAEGMKLGKEPPPFRLQHYIVKPDGSYEYIKPAIPGAKPVTPAPEVTIPKAEAVPEVKGIPLESPIGVVREGLAKLFGERRLTVTPSEFWAKFDELNASKARAKEGSAVWRSLGRDIGIMKQHIEDESISRIPEVTKPPEPIYIDPWGRTPVYLDEGGYKVYLNPRWTGDPNPYEVSRMGYGREAEFATVEEALADAKTRIAQKAIPKAEPVLEAPAKEAVTAKPQAGKVPPVKTPPPTEPPAIEPQEPVPPSGRPRTLLDLNREAKGMRAFSPEDRAAIMDVARPIKEDELLYKVKPFSEHADNLLQPDTPVRAALRAVPGVKQAAGAWTPAQMERNNPPAMIGARKGIFEEIEIGRARLATLNWWHDAEELFKFQKIKGKWRATSIQTSVSAEPSKPYHATIHDLIEHPENYVFTPEQEKVLQIAQDMQRQILRDAQRVGVDAVELTGDYWRRIVTKAPQDKMFGGKVKTRIASRKGYTRQRAFDFVDDGAKLGFEYETHPLTSLQNRLEAGIRTISDQNTRQAIARLPGVVKPLERLESRYPQTVEGVKTARQARDAAKQVFLRDKTVENETALRQAEADYISAMRELFIKKIEAGQPNIGELKLPNGRIAPAELVEEVRKWIDLPEIVTGKGSITNPTLQVTQLLRSTLTNVDLAAGFIQGQALFYRNNIAWWRSQGNAILSLIDDPTAYVAKNFDLMDEGMRMGAISIPTEFMFTRQGLASIPTRIPVVGPVMKSFNRAFEWFILTGQTELYRATRSGAIRRIAGEATEQKSIEALVSLGSAIRKELGTESYAILGVRPTQHTAEQLALFAARFFRALTGIQAQAFTGGEGGREARRAMGTLIAGGIALTIAASYLTEKKMPNMTDPFNPDWMQFQIGKTRFNAFGPFYPYFRTEARASAYMLKGKPVEAANEIKRFFQGKAGIPFRGIDMAAQFAMYGSYRTFEGKKLPLTPLGVGEAVLGEMAVPISAQEAMRALPQGRQEAVVGEVFGLVGREKYPWFPKEIFDAYYEIPANADEAKAQKKPTRRAYRKAYPTVEAKLFITGRVDTISTDMAIEAVIKLVRENKIDPDTISGVKAENEKRAKRRELGLPAPATLTFTYKLVSKLNKLGKTPAPIAPTAPVAPTTPRKLKYNPFSPENRK